MPGIAGVITKMSSRWARPQVSRMVEVMRHESSYETGTWEEESLGVYVGWSLRRSSTRRSLPQFNERGEVALVLAGEDFPEPGVGRRLEQKGHKADGDDTSYLVHLYEEDRRFPAGLNGRFHGLLIDRRCQSATLFNDRWGIERIYYHETKEAVYFAAEAKAILAVRPELRKGDRRSLGEFVACGCVLENRTLFENIYVLPPATSWVFRNGATALRRSYFQPSEWEEQSPLAPEAYYRELRDVFSTNLPRYFNGRDRIGMSLTGGLDTRMIMAWQKSPPGALPCYSFGGTFRDCQDVLLARQVARSVGQPHRVIEVGGEFLLSFPRYAERTVYLSDGCCEVMRATDLYANEQAREIAPVRMTGNFGSEVLRQVPAFKPVEPRPGLYCPELLNDVQRAKVTYTGQVKTHPLSFAMFRQAPWHHYGLLALEQTQVSLRTPYLDNDFVRTVYRAPEAARMSNDICLRLIADGDKALQTIRTDRGLGGSRSGLSAKLSRRLLELSFKAEYAYDYGMPQRLAKLDHFCSPLRLERLFLGRHKFAHFRVWYRDALSGYVRDMLLDPRTLSRPYLEARGVESVVHGHLKGDSNYTTEIHRLLTLEHIHRFFLDS
jgi:asparagine synthase (glutamine-hydrolysing)